MSDPREHSATRDGGTIIDSVSNPQRRFVTDHRAAAVEAGAKVLGGEYVGPVSRLRAHAVIDAALPHLRQEWVERVLSGEAIDRAARMAWEGPDRDWEGYGRCYTWEIARQNDDGKVAMAQIRDAIRAAVGTPAVGNQSLGVGKDNQPRESSRT